MKKIIVVLVLIIALIGLVFVWPTPYSYYTLRGHEVERIIRMNRFTGATERLRDDGWHQYAKATETTTVEAPAAPAKPDDGVISLADVLRAQPQKNSIPAGDEDITDQIKGEAQPQK